MKETVELIWKNVDSDPLKDEKPVKPKFYC